VIRVQSLAKNFGLLRAVDGIDLDIAQGEFFAFLGPNAAGKTTTIRMLTGLLKPSAGTVEICGVDIQKEPERAKMQMAYVPDFPFLYEKLTCTEFMQFVGELYAMDRTAIEQRCDVLFERFHLHDYAHELTENLSHGTRQRLVISSALLHEPRVLIIDEPMVGLDPMHARIVKEEFRARAREGMTIFLSTHQLSVAEDVADRIGIIHRGKIIALGTVAELRELAHESGGLERTFLSLIDAEERMRERIRAGE
jgi:ABC-2 type transport system ATP-binding protein